MSNTHDEYRKVYLSCDDYLRKDFRDYHEWLLNPDWAVLPYITFVEDKGALILTYCKHNSGCNKGYRHFPRQPNNR